MNLGSETVLSEQDRELIERFSGDPLKAETKAKLMALMEVCSRSTEAFALMMLPHDFHVRFQPVHLRIIDALDGDDRLLALAGPRGVGKSTVLKAFILRMITFRKTNLIVYTSSSAEKAIFRTEDIKRELMTNQIIRTIFPGAKVEAGDGYDERWSKKSWVANGRTLVVPRGEGQDHRGILWMANRPNLIVIDDCEDKETITNPEMREKRRTWFNSDVLYCPSMHDKTWRCVLADTIKDADSLLANKLEEPTDVTIGGPLKWKAVRASVCDDDFKSCIPDIRSDSMIDAEIRAASSNGTLYVYAMEQMSLVIPKLGEMSFRESWFQQFEEGDPGFASRLAHLYSFAILDPMKASESGKSDGAVIGVSVDLHAGNVYFRKLVSGKMTPGAQIEALIMVADSIGAQTIGIEVTGLNDFAVHPLMDMLKSSRRMYNVIQLHATGKKEDRIAAMLPYYRNKKVFHETSLAARLQTQLLSYQANVKKDCADVASYFITMLEKTGHYFSAVDIKKNVQDEFRRQDDGEFANVMNDAYAHVPLKFPRAGRSGFRQFRTSF